MQWYLKCAQNLSTVGSVAVSIIVITMTATEKMSDKRILLLAMHEICPTTSQKICYGKLLAQLKKCVYL